MTVSVCRTAYHQLGLVVPVAANDRVVTSCVVNTGAQMCLAGSYILGVLGIKVSDLVQPKTQVSFANSMAIRILGPVFVVISRLTIRGVEEKEPKPLL